MSQLVRYIDGAGEVRTGRVTAGSDGRLSLSDVGDLDAPEERLFTGGFVVGHLTDWHVHLQLVEPGELAAGVLGRVLDLGGNPADVQAHRESPPRGVEIEFAGAFLTAPGGYPSDRSWAPAGSYRELSDTTEARQAVAEMVSAGTSYLKVASNATAGPVPTDEVFTAIVDAASAAGIPVVAHAEGAGEAMRVQRLGAQLLAHTPFSERLTDAEIRAHVETMIWISTLDVHGWGAGGEAFEIARDNLAAFHGLGGRVLYGTDIGNGPLPVGLNARELQALSAAGLTPAAQLAALTPADPTDPDTRLLCVPGDSLDTLDVAATRPLTTSDLTDREDHT